MDKNIKRHLGFNIKKARKAKNWTIEELAKKIDVSKNYIYQIESGRGGFTLETLQKFATALDVDLKYFFELEEKEEISKVKDIELPWRERKNQLTEAGNLNLIVKTVMDILEEKGIEIPIKESQVSQEDYFLELITRLPSDLQKRIQQKILDETYKKLK